MLVSNGMVNAALEAFVRYRVGEDFLRGMKPNEIETLLAPRREQWRGAILVALQAAAAYENVL